MTYIDAGAAVYEERYRSRVLANLHRRAKSLRVLLDFGDSTELLHLASSGTAAELWIAKEGYRNARLEIVGDEGDRAGELDIAAITLNRKNAIFAGHDEGGRTWARMASLIETCKLNAVDLYAYLRETLVIPPSISRLSP